MGGRPYDLVGKDFGKLTVMEDLGIYAKENKASKLHYYLCKCTCGRTKAMAGVSIQHGRSTSCGDCRGITNKHGKGLMRRYQDMITRCYSPKSKWFKDYGARGIAVCDEWMNPLTGYESFAKWAMANGFSEASVLDRINNDGGYSADNCRWTSWRESNINRRYTKNKSGFIGVDQDTEKRYWRGRISIGHKSYYTGYSTDIVIAAKMRDDYIIEHGLSNKLNGVR